MIGMTTVPSVLGVVQPLRAGDAHRHGEPGTQPSADLVDAPSRRGRADQRLGDLQRDPEAPGHGEQTPEERPS